MIPAEFKFMKITLQVMPTPKMEDAWLGYSTSALFP
jgi:hypothetical protein